MFDCHMHTKHFSSDGKMSIEECVSALNALNMGGIITEHIDYDYIDPSMFVFEPEDYFKAFENYRNSRLLLGVEVGMQDICLEKNNSLVSSNHFDMVIASIHLVDHFDIYYKDFYEGLSKKHAYLKYFDAIINGITKFNNFDTLAHLDYICRYAPYENPLITYKDFPEQFEEIFRLIIKNGHALEINTRLFDNPDAVKNIDHIISQYKKAGGKYITVGSDAHYSNNIGNYFETAYNIAENNNLKTVYFKNRNMEYTEK